MSTPNVINTTVGLMYAGALISSILYGLTCLQTFYYFRSYKDKWFIQATVLILWVLDSAHQILLSILTWSVIMVFGGPISNGQLHATRRISAAILLINMLVAELVNVILAWRLWKFSRNMLYLSLILLLLVGHLVLSLIYIIHDFVWNESEFQAVFFNAGFTAPGSTGFITGIAIDCVLNVLLAVGLLYYLSRSKSGFRKSGNIITKLIAMTVSNGLLTSAFMIGQLGSMVHFTANGPSIFNFFTFVTGKMYINTLLTSFNTRQTLKASLGDQTGESLPYELRRQSVFVAGILPVRTIEIMQSLPSSTKCAPSTSKVEHVHEISSPEE